MTTAMLTASVRQAAREFGFDAVGISRLDPAADAYPDPATRTPPGQRLTEWLRCGYHGTMGWMEKNPDRRADPRRVLPGCRSVISVGLNYFTGHQADERPGNGRIARYAWGQDYHAVFDTRLERLEARVKDLAPEARTRRYVDTGPVMEKVWAQQGGLGWIGKHSNLVSTRYGSWLLLGEILSTLDLDPDEPGTDLCGSCQLCIRICPTGAITEPYVVDARRCISYLTIELRQPGDAIPEDLAGKMENRIFGCDDCLDICPFNTATTPTDDPAFQPSEQTLAPSLSALAAMSEQDFLQAFGKSPIRRARHGGFLRNVRAALRNLATRRHGRP